MGLCNSVEDQRTAKSHVDQSQSAPRKQINREMLVQTQKKDETIRRNSGDIDGNQFIVDELENCKVIVTDVCDSMTIDRCKNCELILSAVRGSVFIRDCVNSKFQIVCGQFRCRSCTNCDFYMHVKTRPVVESSIDVRIGCSTVSYPDLINQMNRSGLDPLQNFWYDIHDFTPGEGNYSYMSGTILELSIMEQHEKSLPFTHKKGTLPGGQVFEVTIPDRKLSELITQSYYPSIHLLTVKHTQSVLICEFEATSKSDLETHINSLQGTIHIS